MTQHIGWVRARQIAELAVEVERMRNRIAQLSADVEQMDAAIERIGKARHRGLTRDALAILRRNRVPMLLRDVTVTLMTERAMDTTDRALVTQMLERLRDLMLRQRAYGVVRREEGEGWAALWSVAAKKNRPALTICLLFGGKVLAWSTSERGYAYHASQPGWQILSLGLPSSKHKDILMRDPGSGDMICAAQELLLGWRLQR